jgi:hypothetical protein
VGELGAVGQGGGDVLAREGRVAAQQVLDGVAGGQGVKDESDRDARVLRASFSLAVIKLRISQINP